MLGEPGQWSKGASQSRGALLFCTDKFSLVNKRVLLLALAVASVCPLSGAGQQRTDGPVPAALSNFFKPGVVFQDRNGDGAVDFVDARIVLPEEPSPGELAAASDIAARLGFETSAMNLPVPVSRGFDAAQVSPTIFVGVKSLAGSGVTLEAIGGTGLKAGDGAVIAFSQGGKTAVAVLGGDESGLASAAIVLAGHLPYVWDQKGPTTDKVADDVKQFLGAKGVTASSSTTTAVYTRAGTPEVADRLTVALQMDNGGDFVKAMVALNQFKATAARDAKRPLSYANVREIQIRVRAPGSGSVSIDRPRAAAPHQAAGQAPGRRPGG